MSYDGLPARAATGAREAVADRRTGLLAAAGVTLTLIVAACGSSSSSGGVAGATGTPEATTATSASPSTEASASASAGLNKAFLVFQEQNSSKVNGGGTLIDLGDGSVAVSLGVVAIGFDEPLPARLVTGACTDAASAPAPSFPPVPSAGASAGASAAASLAPSVEPSAAASSGESTAPTPATLPIDLTPVTGGSSSTVVQIALADLLTSPSSVLLYKSAAEPTLVACADVSQTLVIPSTAPGASASEMPAASLPAASGSTAP
jgi:hypothetical protein